MRLIGVESMLNILRHYFEKPGIVDCLARGRVAYMSFGGSDAGESPAV